MKKLLLGFLLALWPLSLYSQHVVDLGMRRNSSGTALDSVYVLLTVGDSLLLRAVDLDSIRYFRERGTTFVDSTKVAFVTDDIATTGSFIRAGTFRRAFLAAPSGQVGQYTIQVKAYKGSQTSANWEENWIISYTVVTDPPGDVDTSDVSLAAVLQGIVHTGATIPTVTNLTNEARIVSSETTTTVLGNVNGNVAGSVGSVTGAVGSVTNEVRVVSAETTTTLLGNVNGNVVGSVGSVTGAVGSVNNEVRIVSAETTTTLLGNVNGNVAGSVGSVTGAVGSVTNEVRVVSAETTTTLLGNVNGNVAGSVGSVTAAVTVGTNNDKTGYSLSAAERSAIYDTLLGQGDEFNLISDPGFEQRPLGQVWKQITATAAIVTNGVDSIPAGRKCLRLTGTSAKVASGSGSNGFYLHAGDRIAFGGRMVAGNVVGGALIGIEDMSQVSKATATFGGTTNGRWNGVFGYWRATGSAEYRMYLLNSTGVSDTSRFDNLWVTVLPDTLGGAAASISAADMGTIAESTWAKKQDRYDAGGFVNSFGRFLDTNITSRPDTTLTKTMMTNNRFARHRSAPGNPNDTVNAVASLQSLGTGPYTATVYFLDSTSGAAIQGWNVSYRDSATGTQYTQAMQSDANGKVAANVIGATTYFVRASKSYYRFAANADTTLNVAAANRTDTVRVVGVTLPSPPAGGWIAITSNIYDLAGDSIQGATITFTLNNLAFFSSDDTTKLVAVAQERRATTDINGNFTINVYPTTKLVASDRRTPARYRVKLTLPNGTGWSTVGADVTVSHTPCCQNFNWNLYRWKPD